MTVTTHEVVGQILRVDIRHVELEGDGLGLGLEEALHHGVVLADGEHGEARELLLFPGTLFGTSGLLLARYGRGYRCAHCGTQGMYSSSQAFWLTL